MRHFMYPLACLFASVQAQVSAQHNPASESFEDGVQGSSVSGQFHSGWESHYFSEGRDALDGDALWVSSLEASWNLLAASILYASSPHTEYDELKVQLAIGHSTGSAEYYLAYTHLEFPIDNADDTEISAGLSVSGMPGDLTFSADVVYSVEAEGSFVDLGAHREIEVSSRTSLNASAVFSFNEGFVSDGHDGANNFLLRLGSETALTDSIALTAYVGNSWAIGRESALPGDQALATFFHGGIGFNWSFGN